MWHDALEAASRKGTREGVHWGMALLATLAVLFFFGILIQRLYDLQIRQHEEFGQLAERNYLRIQSIQPYRGMLKDRRGAVLAENRPSLNAYVYPHEVRDPEGEIELLGKLLGLSPEEKGVLGDAIAGAEGGPQSRILLRQDLPREEVALLEARHLDLPGIRVEPSIKRYYPLGALASHLIGYMNEVNAAELAEREGYEQGDLIGRDGLERAYEDVLRGKKGWRREVRDFRENVQSEEVAHLYYQGPTEEAPIPGKDVILTLDAELERAIEVAFRGRRSGAAVVLDVKTGRVLALYSKPGYDLNEIANGLTSKRKAELDEHPDKPWMNKAMEAYPPGSIFKVITAIAALESGVSPDDQVFCPGDYYLGSHRFRCHGTHGYVNLRQAISRSCDTYFYTRGFELGIDALAKYGSLFGLGEPTGLDTGADRAGIMPSRAWYDKMGRTFSPGMTVNASIGQGDVEATPLQLAVLYAAIANGGTVFTPQIVERIEDTEGRVFSNFSPEIKRKVLLDPLYLKAVQEGLISVTQSGTLREQAEEYQAYRIAGKTGTAQVTSIGEVRRRAQDMTYFARHHAWVAGYAPYDDPEIAVAVFVAHGGGGGVAAGPITMEIISRYFDIFGAQTKVTPSSQPQKKAPGQTGSLGIPEGILGGAP